MKPMKELAQSALDVQSACNLSGIVHSFADVVTSLWFHAREKGHGTDWVNEHPISKLYIDKMASLAGVQSLDWDSITAYAKCMRLAEDGDA